MGRAVIVSLSDLDKAVKQLEEAVTKLRALCDRADRNIPVQYSEYNPSLEATDVEPTT